MLLRVYEIRIGKNTIDKTERSIQNDERQFISTILSIKKTRAACKNGLLKTVIPADFGLPFLIIMEVSMYHVMKQAYQKIQQSLQTVYHIQVILIIQQKEYHKVKQVYLHGTLQIGIIILIIIMFYNLPLFRSYKQYKKPLPIRIIQ